MTLINIKTNIKGGLATTLYLLLLSISSCLCAQELYPRHDINWIHGYDSSGFDGPHKYSWEALLQSFDDGVMTITEIPTRTNYRFTNATISDASGRLVAYTNGCDVFNAAYQVMDNGDSLNTGYSWGIFCTKENGYYGYTVPQGALFLPHDTDSTLYYLYHVEINFYIDPDTVFFSLAPFFRSTIDLKENAGLGRLSPKREVIGTDTLMGVLSATRTLDGEGWWILTGKSNDNNFIRYRQQGDELTGPFYQTIGAISDTYAETGGNGVFSPQGDLFAWLNWRNGLNILNFDRETGLLSKPRWLNIQVSENEFVWCAFASEGRYLYVNTLDSVWQIDTWAADLEEGAVLVAEYDGFVEGGLSTRFFGATLAPDCRIYINSSNGTHWMHYITYPNRQGLACEVRQHAINTPNYVFVALPNMVNYRLGLGPVCDSTITMMVSTEDPLLSPFTPSTNMPVHPNPGHDYVSLSLPTQAEGIVRIFDLQGHLMTERIVRPLAIGMDIDTAPLPPGLYLIVLQQHGQPLRHARWVKL